MCCSFNWVESIKLLWISNELHPYVLFWLTIDAFICWFTKQIAHDPNTENYMQLLYCSNNWSIHHSDFVFHSFHTWNNFCRRDISMNTQPLDLSHAHCTQNTTASSLSLFSSPFSRVQKTHHQNVYEAMPTFSIVQSFWRLKMSM